MLLSCVCPSVRHKLEFCENSDEVQNHTTDTIR